MNFLDHRLEARLPHAGPLVWVSYVVFLLIAGLGFLAFPLSAMALDDAYRRRLHEAVVVVFLLFMIPAHYWQAWPWAPLWSVLFPLFALMMARWFGSMATRQPGWSVVGVGDFVGASLLAIVFGAVATCLAMAGSCMIGRLWGQHHHPLLRDMVLILGTYSLW